MEAKIVKVLLADPRGFCAGVNRAVECLNIALERFGLPLYVRHEIVHNKTVVSDFTKKGVIFIENISDIPIGSNVIFSAHGTPLNIFSQARERNLNIIDATCPLVTSVHAIVQQLEKKDFTIILIGNKRHQEIVGTIGQVNCDVAVIETLDDVAKLVVKDPNKIGYTTQTTLNLDDVTNILNALRKRFPKIIGPRDGNICYATKNRQDIAKQIAKKADLMLILGSTNSSNSKRLMDVCEQYTKAYLVDSCNNIQLSWLTNVKNIGLSAGASAPEFLVQEMIEYLRNHFGNISVQNITGASENIKFNPPTILT